MKGLSFLQNSIGLLTTDHECSVDLPPKVKTFARADLTSICHLALTIMHRHTV